MIKNILSNIFLLVISILKLLSSMYIPLIIISFVLIITILYLSKRVLYLPCNKCQNGSWWYKCKPGTGYGSDTCKNLLFIVDKTTMGVNFILDIPNKLSRINQAFLKHTYNTLIKWLYFMKNVITIMLKLNPTYFIFKLLVEPIMKIIYAIFEKIYKVIEALSFGFVIPVIDIDINIGKLISVAFKALMKLGQLLFNTLVNVFASFAKLLFNEVIQPIIYAISDVIQSVMNTIINILDNLLKEFDVFFNQINNVTKLVTSINIVQYIQFIIDTTIKWTISTILLPLKAIPIIGSLIDYILDNPYILFYIIIIPSVIMIIITFLGQILSVIYFIKYIIYMFLGCDNDLDFIIYILNILETFGIIKSPE